MGNNLFRTWLNSITQIIKKQQEIAAIRGENYNLFRVIHMTSNETSVHSAFIADLLNPKGLHGMGYDFLRLFVDTIKTHGITFDMEGSEVKIEEAIGKKNLEDTSGGRLDIIITNNKGYAIIIENKIYAKDQEAQIARYLNYANKKHKDKFLLLYLSLYGQVHNVDYTTKGVAKIDEDFYTISYKEDILSWLEKCRQLAADRPLLREGISHYINLVKYLTHTNMDAQTKKEMTEIIMKDPIYIKNLNAYKEAIDLAKKALTVNFWEELYSKMYSVYGDKLQIISLKDKEESIYAPSKEQISLLAKDFKLSGERRNYNYNFGLAIPLLSCNSQQLMASIMIDGAISYRVFVVENNDIILYKDENNHFRVLREKLFEMGGNIVVDKWKGHNLYICAKYPNGELDSWWFSEMKDPTLENLSNMESCIETVFEEFKAYVEYIKKIQKEV